MHALSATSVEPNFTPEFKADFEADLPHICGRSRAVHAKYSRGYVFAGLSVPFRFMNLGSYDQFASYFFCD
ncbi:MAG: hypothetical protein QM579_11500, partial [Desulfovibrio sp.]|uniref:hypothetical protein n=1 Tax=Desulfovibrio sp. TaxID=885 RepID=UPI0039E4192D